MRKNILLIVLFVNNLLFSQKEVVQIISANELKPGQTEDHQKLIGDVALKYSDAMLVNMSSIVKRLKMLMMKLTT